MCSPLPICKIIWSENQRCGDLVDPVSPGILEILRKAENAGSWTVNRIVLAHDKSAGLQKRGVLGRSQQAALLFYRGTWPNKMAAEASDNFGGTVSDDIWYNVPRLNRIQW